MTPLKFPLSAEVSGSVWQHLPLYPAVGFGYHTLVTAVRRLPRP